ncbi:MAG: O-antigen ligase family protein, partial [bacterium]|nr:O-antigen ligase family protein [bacterium]
MEIFNLNRIFDLDRYKTRRWDLIVDTTLQNLIIFIILLIMSVIPLILSRLTVDSAIFKTVYSQSFILLAFALWVLRITLRKELNLVKTPLNIPIIALLIWAVISAFLISWNKYEAIKALARFGGYYIFFFIFIDTIRDKYKFNFILHVLLYINGVIITYGLMQRFKLDLFQWEQASSSYRILSTFGNSIFYGNFLIFILPIFLLLGIYHLKELISRKNDGKLSLFIIMMKVILVLVSSFLVLFVSYGLGFLVKRITSFGGAFDNTFIKIILVLIIAFYVLICFLSSYLFKNYFYAGFFLGFGIIGIYSNILTKSRGSWLGLLVSILLIILFILYEISIYFSNKKSEIINEKPDSEITERKPVLKYFLSFAGLSLLLFLTVSIFSYRFLPGDIKTRLSEFNLKSRTVKVRMTIMEGALKMIKARPIFGYGIGSFQIEFPPNRPNDYMLNGVSHNTINAHNEYLQVGAESGAVGFFLFIFLILLYFKNIFYYLIKASSSIYKYILLAFGISILGVLSHSIVSVSMRFTSTGLFFYIFIALSVALINIHYKNQKEESKKIFPGNFPFASLFSLSL